jgi:hypothetical protein
MRFNFPIGFFGILPKKLNSSIVRIFVWTKKYFENVIINDHIKDFTYEIISIHKFMKVRKM